MTLIKDLIEIPERVQQGDFVLRLSEGVNRAEETLRDYVVTPELEECFDNALTFIRSALESNTSKASYLHGSFGSGKSHFMAVLHLILQGNAAARGIPELASVITKHNAWVAGKKFLLVPYHMISAHDMESGILGGYVDFIRRTHPNAPIPGVYLAEGLFQDAKNLRERMGDDQFFATLSEAASSEGGWGDLEAGWDAERFENAMDADPGSEERSQLISALVGKFFGSYDTQSGGHGEAFLSLDKGLSVLSRHAASLGYDGLILFLDELILWLASHAADLKFVHQEGQKLAKLVEAQTPDRPVPIISFVARQRDLSELIGESVPGAERLNFGDALKHWEGRFHKVTLEDRNLPAIAERRVLKCKSEAARGELDAAFEQTQKIREAVMNTLLTSEGDRGMFRKVYPFSPALVQTLIAVSSVLQRERTALKVMLQLLVDQRETLQVGDIVPVGDLFDVIAHGDEAFSQEMAIHFDNAKRLYHQKLLPVLEKQHGRREDIAQTPTTDPKRVAFRNDDRLVKTLLLAALVPEVESLRALNAERLAALNHGTIKTPIPGREGQEVLRRCRTWAASVGEIRIGEESTNPTIAIQLSGVDTETIIEQARREDNQGNRIRRVRQMLFEQLQIEGEDEFEQSHNFMWRNTKRSCSVLFKNVRELSDTSFKNTDERWRLIIDFPFDEQGYGPRDDLSRIQVFQQAHPEGTKTLCWVPTFFSAEAQKDLGMLVILEHILKGERFAQYANHLSPQDRQAAKSLLENQRSTLRQQVQDHLDAAYGLESLRPGSLDTVHELEPSEHFISLWHGFEPRPPVAADLAGAMHHLLSQTLEHEFPAAPHFEEEITTNNLKKVYEQVRAATRTEDGRVAIDKPLRPLLRHVANPLLLGEMGHDATHFVLGQHWKTHLTKKAAETGSAITVSQLRQWIDEPKPMGLPREAENVAILVFAEQTNRTFFLHGAPFDATLTNLPDQLELREQKLPDPQHWDVALRHAGSIFGVVGSPLLKASNVTNLVTSVQQQTAASRSACQVYCQRLRERLGKLGIAVGETARLKTASATLVLLERIQQAKPDEVINVLATAEIATSESAMGTCLSQAATLGAVLGGTDWEIFEAIGKLSDERQSTAAEIRGTVEQALRNDEHVVQLGPALQTAHSKAVRLLTATAKLPEPPQKPPEPTPVPKPGKRVVGQGAKENLEITAATELLSSLGQELRNGQVLRVNLSWIIEEGGTTQ
ncbi:MAG: DUF6079 family protein [Candidatus Binatia bacterium]